MCVWLTTRMGVMFYRNFLKVDLFIWFNWIERRVPTELIVINAQKTARSNAAFYSCFPHFKATKFLTATGSVT